jgi:hypothetical protein
LISWASARVVVSVISSARPGHGGRSIGSAITSGDGLVTLLLQLA